MMTRDQFKETIAVLFHTMDDPTHAEAFERLYDKFLLEEWDLQVLRGKEILSVPYCQTCGHTCRNCLQESRKVNQ